MVVSKINEGPSLDSEAERARLARLAEAQAKKAEEERQAAEKKAAEEKAAEEKRQAEIKAAEEKRAAEEKAVAEKKAAEEKAVAEKKAAEEKAAAEKKAAEEKAAAEKKAEEERKAAEARRIEEARIAEERQKEEARLAEEKRLAEKKRLEEEAAAEKAKREADEKKKMAEAMIDMEKINELDDGPILFDTFGEMGLLCVSHRESSVIKADKDGVKVVIGCCNLDRTRMMVRLEREDKSVVGEHAVMCTMSHNSSLGPHFVAQAVIPEPGNYALKFFCNNEAGKTGYAHVATYNIEAAMASERAGQRYPKLHPAVPMALLEPLCDEIAAGRTVEIKVVLGPGVTAAQVATADGKRYPLHEKAAGELRVASGTVTIASGSQNEGMTSIICQKDGAEEWVVFVKFAVV